MRHPPWERTKHTEVYALPRTFTLSVQRAHFGAVFENMDSEIFLWWRCFVPDSIDDLVVVLIMI